MTKFKSKNDKEKIICLEGNSKGDVAHYSASSKDNAVVKTLL